MKSTSRRYFSAILSLLAISVRAQSITDVQSTVHQRTGQRVEWRKDAKADGEVARAVHSLLRGQLTADTAVQIALLNNRELQATFEDIGMANADFIEAGLLKNPVFEGSARFPDRPPSAADVELSIAQDFLDLLMLPLRKKVAAAELARAKLLLGEAVLKLSTEVKTAFYTLQARQQLFAGVEALRETNTAALQLSLQQHEAGNINDLELANQQATYSQSKLDAAEVQVEIRSDREKLNRLMGLWGEDIGWRITGELPLVSEKDFSSQRLESIAIAQRLDLAAAKAQLGSLVQALGLSRTYRYAGTVEFGVDSERQSDRQRITGPTLRLELPILNHGQGRIARLQAQLRQAERRLESQAIEIRSEVREARDRLAAKRDLAAYYHDELLPERQRVLDLTLTHYNAMLKGAYELLLAKQNELTAQRGYIEALRDFWIARADLERATGGRITNGAEGKGAAANLTQTPKPH